MHDNKLFKNFVKLIFSSLFARKTKCAITCPGSNEMVFSSLLPEKFFNSFGIDETLHVVKFKSEIFKEFMERYPVLNSARWMIDPGKMSSTFDKVEVDDIYHHDKQLFVRGYVKESKTTEKYKQFLDETALVKEGYFGVKICIGVVFSDHIFSRYEVLYKDFNPQSENVRSLSINHAEIKKAKASFVSIVSLFSDLENISWNKLVVPLFDGLTNVCVCEYGKRSKQDGVWSVLATIDNRVINYVIKYEDDDLLVYSFRPGMNLYV